MDKSINEELHLLTKTMDKYKNDIVIINKNVYSLKELLKLNTNQLYSLLLIRPGMKLYKYCSFGKHTLDNIKKGKVYLSNPTSFDDCFDSTSDTDEYMFINQRLMTYLTILNVKFDCDATNEELSFLLFLKMGEVAKTTDEFIEYLKDLNLSELLCKKLQILYMNVVVSQYFKDKSIESALHDEFIDYCNSVNNYRISCFTTNPTDIKMWSLYADNNRGICIEYTVDDNPDKLVFSVLYSHIRGDYNLCTALDDYDNDENAFIRVLIESVLRKDICWTEQNEYRYVSTNNMYESNLAPFYPITAIYIGNKISKRNYSIMVKLCKELDINCYYMQRNIIQFELHPLKITKG